MTRARWVKREAGWYELEGTPYNVVNMRGEAVRYGGHTTPTWEVRKHGKVVNTMFTMRLARQEAERLHEQGS